MTHTKEPWDAPATMPDGSPMPPSAGYYVLDYDDAVRAVECVNACAGVTGINGPIPPGAFRRAVEALTGMRAYIDACRGLINDVPQALAVIDKALSGLSLTDTTKGEG